MSDRTPITPPHEPYAIELWPGRVFLQGRPQHAICDHVKKRIIIAADERERQRIEQIIDAAIKSFLGPLDRDGEEVDDER